MGHVEPGSKHVCKCEKCGNEAEMVVTCSLEPTEEEKSAVKMKNPEKVKAVCSTCGNEADMWIDID